MKIYSEQQVFEMSIKEDSLLKLIIKLSTTLNFEELEKLSILTLSNSKNEVNSNFGSRSCHHFDGHCLDH